MTARLIPDQLTKLSLEEGIQAVADGYHRMMGAAPMARCLAVLAAQSCLETGNWQLMHCFCPGNKKKPADWDGPYTTFRCDELFDAPTTAHAQRLGPCEVHTWSAAKDGSARFRVVLPAGHPWAFFVGFETAAEGFADWLELLALTDRYRAAWKCAFAGDAAGFVRALAAGHYFTADVEVYVKAVVSIANRIELACERLLALGDHGLTDEDRAAIAAEVYAVTQQSAEDALHGAEPFPLPEDVA